ncbi:N-acetyltransferase family protein [Kaarinaea lacus]
MIEIRAATPDDFTSIARIIPDQYELFLVYPKGQYPFTATQVQHLYSERFEFTVVCDEDKLIGFANLYDRMQDHYAFIGNVFIHPDYRGQGLGKLVLQYMIKAAFEKYQFTEVRLSVFADNKRAIALYQQNGFSEYSKELRTDPDNEEKVLLHMSLANPNVD